MRYKLMAKADGLWLLVEDLPSGRSSLERLNTEQSGIVGAVYKETWKILREQASEEEPA